MAYIYIFEISLPHKTYLQQRVEEWRHAGSLPVRLSFLSVKVYNPTVLSHCVNPDCARHLDC